MLTNEILAAHTGVSGADFVDFMTEVAEFCARGKKQSVRILLQPLSDVESLLGPNAIRGEVPDPDMHVFVVLKCKREQPL